MSIELDDPAAIAAADQGALLPATASAAAQVREAGTLTAEAGLSLIGSDGRPRAVVMLGVGPSGLVGEVLAAVAGPGCPVPVLRHAGYGLPAWVGAADLVVAVSASGGTEETLSGLEEAVRRGCRLVTVGVAGSPLAELGARGRGLAVPVRPGRPVAASLWALATPVLLAARELGLLRVDVEAAAAVLEQVAARCRPDADPVSNPAKRLALDLEGTLPLAWGCSPVAAVAARRLADRLAGDAGLPALFGELPDAGHQQAGVLAGPWTRGAAAGDLFRDRADEPDRPALHLVLLRDEDEHPQVARRAQGWAQRAGAGGTGVSELRAAPGDALSRLAELVALVDFTAGYAALLAGTGPAPAEAVADVTGRAEL